MLPNIIEIWSKITPKSIQKGLPGHPQNAPPQADRPRREGGEGRECRRAGRGRGWGLPPHPPTPIAEGGLFHI